MNIRKALFSMILAISAMTCIANENNQKYTILASMRVKSNPEWFQVVEVLQESHPEASVLFYQEHPDEMVEQLRLLRPRYVAVVEQPEAIGQQFVMRFNRISRKIDQDPYEDFIGGIITGYNAQTALRIVKDARKPLVLRDAFSTIHDLEAGKWFDCYAYIADQRPGGYYYTRLTKAEDLTEHQATDSIANNLYLKSWKKAVAQWGDSARYHYPKDFSVQKPNTLKPFCDLYAQIDPDIIFTASHATEKNLEMPYSTGNIMCKDGRLYADFPEQPVYLTESGKTRVYLPIGNCLIGNINHTANSMACAWMHSANVSAMVGYVVPTWYGRNGWGGLRTLVTQSGRYTIAEAFYLNRQDLLFRLQENAPDLLEKEFPYNEKDDIEKEFEDATQVAGREISVDEAGQWYDRDVVAYYGDPAWNVRLQEIPQEQDLQVEMKVKRKTCIITIKTSADFSAERMAGANLPKENLQPQPFTYIFPERLKNPRLSKNEQWKAVVDENFLLIYDTQFKPSSVYQIKIECDGIL